MKHERDDLTLDDLAHAVGRLLQEQGLLGAVADGRVSAVPDARTVRYYTTLGLLDRPQIVDRQARYCRRHTLQLLAIKALQAESLPLAAIQERLYGRSDAELEALLGAVRQARDGRPPEVVALLWREVTIAPGLKLLAQDGWKPGENPAALLERIRATLAALGHPEGVPA